MRQLASLKLPLPKGWPACIKTALLDAIALGRMALLDVAADFENSPLPRAQYAADLSRMQRLLALRDEECRILRARMACIPAARRPQIFSHRQDHQRLDAAPRRARTSSSRAAERAGQQVPRLRDCGRPAAACNGACDGQSPHRADPGPCRSEAVMPALLFLDLRCLGPLLSLGGRMEAVPQATHCPSRLPAAR